MTHVRGIRRSPHMCRYKGISNSRVAMSRLNVSSPKIESGSSRRILALDQRCACDAPIIHFPPLAPFPEGNTVNIALSGIPLQVRLICTKIVTFRMTTHVKSCPFHIIYMYIYVVLYRHGSSRCLRRAGRSLFEQVVHEIASY